MSLKLRAQLDDAGNPDLPVKLYKSYVDYNKWRFPESALEIIAHPDWIGGSESKSPYYSDLVSCEIKELGSLKGELKLLLVKDMYVEGP